MTAAGRGALVAAGVALIACWIVAAGVKFASLGWATLFLIIFAPLLALLWALAIVIAATGFLSARAAFASAPGRGRGLVAAWTTAASLILAAFFMADGGDATFGSTFMIVIGASGDAALLDVSGALSLVFAILAAVALVWLTVEWILALVRRRRRG